VEHISVFVAGFERNGTKPEKPDLQCCKCRKTFPREIMERVKCIRSIHICPVCKNPKQQPDNEDLILLLESSLIKGMTITEITDSLICKKDLDKIRKMLSGTRKEQIEMLIKQNRKTKRCVNVKND